MMMFANPKTMQDFEGSVIALREHRPQSAE